LDQTWLFSEGLKHVRRLSRRIWTDHNVHDPGVTILELLCYALTDLSYRASFPIEDLLESGLDKSDASQALFTPRKVLPNRPVTLLDYRKLIIDVVGINNAWVFPADVTYYADVVHRKLHRDKPEGPDVREVRIKGLYDVLVEYDDPNATAVERAAILDGVRRTLNRNRCLCEDFVNITGIDQQAFCLCGEIEIDPGADEAWIAAEMLVRVQEYFAPSVRRYSLSEMLERKHEDGTVYTADEIFTGPALEYGFIDDQELVGSELRTQLRLSDVVNIVMDIKGVRAARKLLLGYEGGTEPLEDRWVIDVAPGKQPTLLQVASRLVFYKSNMPVRPPKERVAEHLAQLSKASKKDKETEKDLLLPKGRVRDVATYHSVQNHFPALYGLSDTGIPGVAPEEYEARKAAAYQLKAYLLFFDQVMADYCFQLAHVRELFSIKDRGKDKDENKNEDEDKDKAPTYFTQIVDSFRDYEHIYKGLGEKAPDAEPEEWAKKLAELAKELAQLTEDGAQAAERRNRFLDHLVARFAEQFHEYASVMRSAFPDEYSVRAMIRAKCAFLENYPEIGAERALAYDYSLRSAEKMWNTTNVSGLQRRVARLLDIADATRRDLGFGIDAETPPTNAGKFCFRLYDRTDGADAQRKTLFESAQDFDKEEEAKRQLARAIDYAQEDGAYRDEVTDGNKYRFTIVADGEEVLAVSQDFDSADARDKAKDALLRYVETHYGRLREGMYLIENILLRPDPNVPNDPFLPICVDPDSGDGADMDPYSYRIQIILPAGVGRFRGMDFRRFVEEVIREETPAHILPRICWIDMSAMTTLQPVYRAWIELRSGANTTERTRKIGNLMRALNSARNVYPARRLRECADAKGGPQFIVGRAVLGSMENTGEP